jgi:hypothetical protein
VKKFCRFAVITAMAAAIPVCLFTAVASASPSHADHNSAAAEAAAAFAAARVSAAKPTANAAIDQPTQCNGGDFCIYSSVVNCVLGVGSCPAPCDQTAANVNHNYTTCANTDEALYNNMPSGKARLYYAKNGWDGGIAWICIDHGDYILNLSTGSKRNNGGPYLFDQGKGDSGYRHIVWRDAHSVSTLSTGSCYPNE